MQSKTSHNPKERKLSYTKAMVINMGVVFTLFFLACIFGIAMFFIIISSIILIVRHVRKKRGKAVKKRWFVIPMIFLVLNILIAMMPVGFILFLRYQNNVDRAPIVYAESGKSVYWPIDRDELNRTWFEMNGIKYVELQNYAMREKFSFYPTKDTRGDPIANIRSNPDDSNLFNEAMHILMTGKNTYNLYVSTIYPLINENRFELLELDGYSENGFFCPESKKASIAAYYLDISNYDPQNISSKQKVNDDKKKAGEYQNSYKDIIKEISFTPEILEQLGRDQDMNLVEVPQKYIEIKEADEPGTPIYGYDSRILTIYSKDKLATKEINLVLLENQVYIHKGYDDEYINVCPVSDEMNQYIIDTVFTD